MIDDDEFARAFGALLRRHITRLGLTYDRVAYDIWGETGNKSNVSGYVNGRKGRPNARTISKFREALRIPQVEIDELEQPDQISIDALVAAEVNRAREFGIKEGMLIALARRYALGTPNDFEAALSGLEYAVQTARDELERNKANLGASKTVNATISEIDALNEKGDLHAGMTLLEEELIAFESEDAKRKAARLRLFEKGLTQSILVRSAVDACRFVLLAFDLEADEHSTKGFSRLRNTFRQWFQRGYEKGLNFELEVSILLAKEMIKRAETTSQRRTMMSDLGRALWRLGERESGISHLEEAVEVFRTALRDYSREQAPFEWADVQNALGLVLWRIGERESEIDKLEEAVEVFQLALEERTRELVPLDWAATQNCYGLALWSLGKRDKGTDRLNLAVEAFESSLEERTRILSPIKWARTMSNLGNAFTTLGKREQQPALFEKAAIAYRAALEERTREGNPLEWARTMNNLGNALLNLGKQDEGTKRLYEAARVFEEALEERTRKRVPLEWARTKNNLGTALRYIGSREHASSVLMKAVEAYHDALKERTRTRVPLDWAATVNNLGLALHEHGRQVKSAAVLKEASVAFSDALEERTLGRVPLDWAETHLNQGELIVTEVASGFQDNEAISKALEHLENALQIFQEAKSLSNIQRASLALRQAKSVGKVVH